MFGRKLKEAIKYWREQAEKAQFQLRNEKDTCERLKEDLADVCEKRASEQRQAEDIVNDAEKMVKDAEAKAERLQEEAGILKAHLEGFARSVELPAPDWMRRVLSGVGAEHDWWKAVEGKIQQHVRLATRALIVNGSTSETRHYNAGYVAGLEDVLHDLRRLVNPAKGEEEGKG